jgi:hypothetical protein
MMKMFSKFSDEEDGKVPAIRYMHTDEGLEDVFSSSS